jgi:hypothetical protein
VVWDGGYLLAAVVAAAAEDDAARPLDAGVARHRDTASAAGVA